MLRYGIEIDTCSYVEDILQFGGFVLLVEEVTVDFGGNVVQNQRRSRCELMVKTDKADVFSHSSLPGQLGGPAADAGAAGGLQ